MTTPLTEQSLQAQLDQLHALRLRGSSREESDDKGGGCADGFMESNHGLCLSFRLKAEATGTE